MVKIDGQKRVIVLGVHSFLDNSVKVGIQYIAEGLADRGWQVDYFSIFSSLFDVYGRQRRQRLRRVWLRRQYQNGIKIKPGLTEYAFRAPFPAHKLFLRYCWQTKMFSFCTPTWLSSRHYDICIHDVTANVLYLSRAQSTHTILRLNDLPEGFGHSLSKQVIQHISAAIQINRYREIWSAHRPLTDYALALNPTNRVLTVPNGVDDDQLKTFSNATRKTNSVVYLGSIEKWVDLELVDKVALILKDWQFDFYGPLRRSWSIHSSNVRLLPPIERSSIKTVLGRYQVGLIPFRDISGRLAYVERPLKFFEYMAAGLGVACTDVGSLKSGIGEMASYANSPQSLADAIQREAIRAKRRTQAECVEMVKPYAWSSVMQTINTRLTNLDSSSTLDFRQK